MITPLWLWWIVGITSYLITGVLYALWRADEKIVAAGQVWDLSWISMLARWFDDRQDRSERRFVWCFGWVWLLWPVAPFALWLLWRCCRRLGLKGF